MKKKIEDYLHLYLGCEIYWSNAPTEILTAKRLYELFLYGDDYDEYKLVLRPLSDIKHKDTNEIADALDIVTGNCYLWLTEIIQTGGARFETSVKLTNELRKRQFDVDGLIDAGLAIDKTKHKA